MNQGLVVAIIYCFLNSEVTTLLKNSIIESKPFRAFIYDSKGAPTPMAGSRQNSTHAVRRQTTSDIDYAQPDEEAAMTNPIKRLRQSLLRSAQEAALRDPVTREYRMSLSSRYPPDETKL